MVKPISNSASKIDIRHPKSLNKDEFNDFVSKEFEKKKSKMVDVSPNALTIPLTHTLHEKSMHGGGYTQTDKKLEHSVKAEKRFLSHQLSSLKNKHAQPYREKASAAKNISLSQLNDKPLQQIKDVTSLTGNSVSSDKKSAVVDDKKYMEDDSNTINDDKSLPSQHPFLHVKDTHDVNQNSVSSKHGNEQIWTPVSAPKIPLASMEQNKLPVNLNYQFNSWSGKHFVNVSGMNNAELGTNVLLSPSDTYTESVLKQHKDIFHGVSSLIIDSENEREKNRNPQQQHNDDEDES